MNSSFRLGRIAGIEIGVNWTWLIVFGLLVWSLATSVFPDWEPARGDRTYYTMAVVAAVLFFSTLLAHELGHAFQARRDGMEIDGITLWLFGGVARFRGTFPSAGAEFRIAIAGPLVSLVLGGLLIGASYLLPLPDVVDTVAFWLGFINLFLLAFNLLPALPLDGGRVLRSALWRARGDFAWATRIAVALGRLFALAFVLGGLALLAFADDAYSGGWLMVLGWFLFSAVGGESRQLAVREALDRMRVRDVMVQAPVTVRADLRLDELMDAVAHTPHESYPVVEDGRVVGLLPFPGAVPAPERASRSVRELMIPADDVPVIAPGADVEEALRELMRAHASLGVVLDGGALVGFVAASDLARALEARRRLAG